MKILTLIASRRDHTFAMKHLLPSIFLSGFYLCVSVFLGACQFSPYSRGEDPNIYVQQVMQALKAQAPSDFTPPSDAEEVIVNNAIVTLMFREDPRYYPLILLLKESKVELMVQDAERLASSSEAQKDPLYAHELMFYAEALRTYLKPTVALERLQRAGSANSSQYPTDWLPLTNLIDKRLSAPENQLLLLKKSLLSAESQGNIGEQLRLHEQILTLMNKQGKKADVSAMTFHLNRIISLTPGQNLRRVGQWETLAELYRRQGEATLAESCLRQALDTAQVINDSPSIARLQQRLGIVPINEDWVKFAKEAHQRITDLNRTITTLEGGNTSENTLALVESYWRVGQTNLAEKQAINALAQARHENNLVAESAAIKILGDLARINGDFRRAQSQYALASALISAQKTSELNYVLPMNMAMMAFFQGQADSAMESLKTILDQAKKDNQPLYVARAQAEIFIVQAMQAKQFNNQSSEWLSSISVLQQLDSSGENEESVMAEAGVVLAGLSQHQAAITTYDRAIAIAASQKRYFSMARYQVNRALALQRLGQRADALQQFKLVESLLRLLNSDMLASVQSLMAPLERQSE